MTAGFRKSDGRLFPKGTLTVPLLAAAFVLFGSIITIALIERQTGVAGPVSCPFRWATGHPCFLCGGTRTGLSLLRGDVATAFSTNPLVAAGLSIMGVLFVMRLFFRLSPFVEGIPRRGWWSAALTVIVLNWAWVWVTLPR